MLSRIRDLEENSDSFLRVYDECVEKVVSSTWNEELQCIQIEELRNDITNVLEFIRRVNDNDCWNATGLNFNEVKGEDIFGTKDMFPRHTVGRVCDNQLSATMSTSAETPHQSQGEDAIVVYPNDEISSLLRDLERCNDGIRREMSKYGRVIAMLKCDMENKDEEIQGCLRRIQTFHNNMCKKPNECSTEYQSLCGDAAKGCLRYRLEDILGCFQMVLAQKEELIAEAKCLKTELKESKAETEELRKTVDDMKQSNKDTRECLAAEVAEKHEEIIVARRMIQHLTDTCREAEKMVRLKDDIIKQMRKDQRDSAFKLVSENAELKDDVSIIQPDDPSDNQQVQSSVNQSEFGLEQVNTSPDELQKSFPHKCHRSSGTSGSKNNGNSGNGGNTKATKYHCVIC